MMKIVIFGATGGIGGEAMRQALDAGHLVTAVARRPEAITLKHERLTVMQGDVMQPETLLAPVFGQDAVISAIGIPKDIPTTLYSDGVSNILAAMHVAGVTRILCISASGLDPGPWWQRHLAKPLLWRMFKYSYTDLVRMETVLQKSDAQWTILRPPRLSNKPRTGQYNSVINEHLYSGYTVSRADVADYMLKHLNDTHTYCGIVEIAY